MSGSEEFPDLGEEAGPFPLGVLASGGLVDDVRHLGALTEEVYEPRLPDPASAAEQQRPAALVAAAVAHPGEVAVQSGQLGCAAYEAWHGAPLIARIEHTQVNHSMENASNEKTAMSDPCPHAFPLAAEGFLVHRPARRYSGCG